MRDRAKVWLADRPTLYRVASLTFRSAAVAKGMAYLVKRATPIMMGARPIVVDYWGEPRPRWGLDPSGHPRLAEVIAARRSEFEALIRSFGAVRSALERIQQAARLDDPEPAWINGFFGGLDAAALYGILAVSRPRRYFEIGSGNSTKFARRAIRDQGLETTILSIDPAPRWEIDALCDTVIRKPLEEVDPTLFDELEEGDILFFDGSHHAFMNSDVVTFFLDIVPRLKAGVLVQVHDIFLPYDYPDDWASRFYSEQYLLAVALLSPAPAFDIVLANQFVVNDPSLAQLVHEQLGALALGANVDAASFWLRTKAG